MWVVGVVGVVVVVVTGIAVEGGRGVETTQILKCFSTDPSGPQISQ